MCNIWFFLVKKNETIKKLGKLLIILGFGVIVIFLGIQLYITYNNSKLEKYAYKVVKVDNNIEFREYESRLFTSITLPSGKYEEISKKGFRVLAGYIFGKNNKNQKIAMTSPVSMSLEDSSTMMFMVPSMYDKKKLPIPINNEINFIEIPAKKLIAIRYGGWSTSEKIEVHKQLLIQYLQKHQIPHRNNFYYFGYNAPFEIFNRRNEVLVELE